jgi:regulatory protein
MPRVSDIKQQVKRQDRYSIYLDGKYVFSLSENELFKSGLRVGREYLPDEIEDLQATAVLDKAYMRAIEHLARRARSEWEVRDYLKRKEYDSPTIDIIVNKLSNMGYINDKAFATSWVENRRLLKATSLRRLRQELQQKRVSKEVSDEVLAADETDERQVLKELIAKKQTQTRYQDSQKLMAYLMRQGFNYDDLKAVINENDN